MVQISLTQNEVRLIASKLFLEAIDKKSISDTQMTYDNLRIIKKFIKSSKGEDKRIFKSMYNRIVRDNKLPFLEYKLTRGKA